MILKPVGEVLTGATFRLGGYRGTRVDRTKMNIWMKIGFFKQISSDVLTSPVPGCITGMDSTPDWGMCLLLCLIKQKACKSALRPALIGHAKWKPLELP